MTSKRMYLACAALAGASCIPLLAQEKSARDRLAAAHGQYYTPTASGLKSFHCDATMDWRGMLTRFTGTEIPDDNPALKFLNAVKLGVSDDLRGKGGLEWTEPGPPPAGREDSIKQTREGFQQAVAGFFQTWNTFVNGSMVPLPDQTVSVTPSGQGVHISGTSKEMKIDADFDKNMLLTQTLVESSEIRVLLMPTYVSTGDGLVVSSIKSQIHQPPTAPEQDANFEVEYAKVDSFQIPSRVALDIKNTGVLEFRMNNCQVLLAEWAKKQ